MSRQSVAPQRNLSLTEELEKLEQSITLTLQEIDHNFSRAHRIVTTEILPIVEQYGKHSEAVWEGSKFWKQFFEASANVSLSGYEAAEQDESTTQEDTQQSQLYDDETAEDETLTGGVTTPPRPLSAHEDDVESTITFDSPSLGHSTPRAPTWTNKSRKKSHDEDAQFAGLSSPYEAFKQELEGSKTPNLDPVTPGKSQALPDLTGQFDSSPFVQPTTGKKLQLNQDALLHRVLDKTFRVQATPIVSPRKYKPTGAFTPRANQRGMPTPRGTAADLSRWAEDSSPPSSPAPQLRADIFSPAKTPRTPGISVQTPGRGKQPMSIGRTGTVFDDSDDDEEEELDYSPPKTIQFHIPQSKLLQTPAREASRRIVDDLLLTAGGDITDTTGGMDEDSPSVVRRQRPPTSGYARIAQAEEEEDSELEDDERQQNSLSNPQYAPVQPQRNSHMRMASGSGPSSPSQRRISSGRRQRSNSGFERWADEIAQKFKIKKQKESLEDERLEIHHSVFQAPDGVRPATAETLSMDMDGPSDRITAVQFDETVESVRTAIEMGMHPLLITQGSSGSYFARNTQGKVVGVFKPKDEEPYASRNPKWTKWIHRNLFPFFFGRACLIPNLSYVSEAAAYVLDTQLRTNLVPYTDVVGLSSKSFHYDFWDRRAFYRKKKPFPEKLGSFQVFLRGFKDANIFLKEHPWPDQHSGGLRAEGASGKKKKRRWAEDCRPSGPQSDNEDGDEDEDERSTTAHHQRQRGGFWSEPLQQSFREQLEKLVILDYIMRNTDRGLDNWMIKIDQKTQAATIVAEPPKMEGDTGDDPQPSHYTRQSMEELDPYGRREPMTATSRSNTPAPSAATPAVTIGAIDNSLSWPWKHPDAWRSYPFGWLFLPVSLIGQPFSEATRRHFLPLLTSKQWWSETQLALKNCFSQDADFKDRMYAKQIAVMKGQAWNVVETLKTQDHGPLELTRRARVCVWDDVVEIPIAVPLRAPSVDIPRKQQSGRPHRLDEQHEEMDITAVSTPPQKPQSDLLLNSPPLEAAHENRFNLSRDSSSLDVRRSENAGPTSSATVNGVHWSPRNIPESQNGRPVHRSRMSYDMPRRNPFEARKLPRRFSLTQRSDLDEYGFDDDGDLGYAANEDMEGNRKKVIVERLEMVKGRNPVFTWC
ncbi:phosphatidylinositol 3 and 4-kinase-domain-containing protein [Phaeosphaeriaceae sp. PMI808]|nr:phosphatidylinositol 3 and 4-kinase-domain-containing protein [Phaeosphaeriaceae sp. PMI808]